MVRLRGPSFAVRDNEGELLAGGAIWLQTGSLRFAEFDCSMGRLDRAVDSFNLD